MDTYTAIIEKDEDMYVATCPEIGTASQGATVEEALTNLPEAKNSHRNKKSKHFLQLFK